MTFEDLPKGIQHDIQTILFKMEIENDEDDRRRLTTFGYNHGKIPGLFMWLYAPLALAAFTILGLAVFYFPRSDTTLGTSSLVWWVIIPPFALLPVTPFVFLKPRYALVAVGVIIGICMVLMGVMAMFYGVLGMTL